MPAERRPGSPHAPRAPHEARAARPGRSAAASAVALLAATLLAATPARAASIGPQPGMTGAPGAGAEPPEGLCVSCHTSFPVNPDALGKVTLEGVPDRYEAGRAYTLTMRVSHPDAAALRWGFQLTAVAAKDGSGAGEFVATDAATTQVLASMSGTRTYVCHSYGGTAIGQAGGNAWTFEWKAPATTTGPVAFYGAANAANADGSNQGDRIYTKSPAPLAETKP